jgi:hypothetical protein
MSARQFENFRASSLFCARCAKAMPVRERLLLVLPDKELFAYHCTGCDDEIGSREVTVMEQLLVKKAAVRRSGPQVRLL